MSIEIQEITDIDAFIEKESARIANPDLIDGIPAHTHGTLMRYLNHKIPPGSFLTAMLVGDLHGTMRCADDINIRFIKEIYQFLRWKVPLHAWGTPENVKNWLKGQEWD